MRELPILFSGAMVRAILDGRKTQTRRVVKPSRAWPIGFIGGASDQDDPSCYGFEDYNTALWWTLATDGRDDTRQIPCPYGAVGDRLWVRESFAFTDAHSGEFDASIEYRADNKCYAIKGRDRVDAPHGCDPKPFAGPWKPSIHMPRWASRIALEVIGVRVERLNEVSEADAAAEGVKNIDVGYVCWKDYLESQDGSDHMTFLKASDSFATLWDQINGGGSWDKNPWVWVVEFRRIKA